MIVVFDFDGTLIKSDITNHILKNARLNHGFIIKLKSSFISLIYKFKLISNSSYKQYLINCFFKNFEEYRSASIDDLLLNKKVFNTIESYLDLDYEVVISSASDSYLVETFLSRFIDTSQIKIHGSSVSFENEKFILLNNHGKSKVKKFKKYYFSNKPDLFYTDNVFSDFPLILYSKKVILVSPSNKKLLVNSLFSLISKNITKV